MLPIARKRALCILWSGVLERSIGVESDFGVAKVEWTANVMCVCVRVCVCVCVCVLCVVCVCVLLIHYYYKIT